MTRPILAAFRRALGAACLIVVPLTGSAQDAAEGKTLYALYCATCHGSDATGTGPTAEIMTIQPPDLTVLASGNGGAFPLERVIRRIDGRDPVIAHGSPMPVFGPFFEGNDTAIKTDAGQPVMTSRAVVDLVTWLKTVQAE